EARIFGLGKRQPYRLRHDLALERGDRSLDRHGDLRRAGPGGRALKAFVAELAAKLAKTVFSLAPEGNEPVLVVDHRLHDASVAALRGNTVELLMHSDRV